MEPRGDHNNVSIALLSGNKGILCGFSMETVYVQLLLLYLTCYPACSTLFFFYYTGLAIVEQIWLFKIQCLKTQIITIILRDSRCSQKPRLHSPTALVCFKPVTWQIGLWCKIIFFQKENGDNNSTDSTGLYDLNKVLCKELDR